MIEKTIEKELSLFVGNVTPGVKVQVFHKGGLVANVEKGEVYPFYDLASLTKVLFTVTAFMHLYQKNPRILEDRILKFLPWFLNPSVNVRELLTHTSGLTWWRPFYESLHLKDTREKRWEFLKHLLAQEKLELSTKAVYSDLNFLLLGYILEAELKKPLEEIWQDVRNEFGLKDTTFHIDNKPLHDVSKYAPTEECKWREKRLQGQVHDENAFALGGVAPHAGLFGSVDDVSKWMLGLRDLFFGEVSKKGSFISSETVQSFFNRAIASQVGDFSLGFMMKSAKNSTAGNLLSSKTVGHTGFTGTSIWFDPTNDIVVSIVSNRVFFGRENVEQFRGLRVAVHDSVFRSLIA